MQTSRPRPPHHPHWQVIWHADLKAQTSPSPTLFHWSFAIWLLVVLGKVSGTATLDSRAQPFTIKLNHTKTTVSMKVISYAQVIIYPLKKSYHVVPYRSTLCNTIYHTMLVALYFGSLGKKGLMETILANKLVPPGECLTIAQMSLGKSFLWWWILVFIVKPPK